MKAAIKLKCHITPIPFGHHPKAAQGLYSNSWPTATEPLTTRRGAIGPNGTREGGVWPDRSPTGRQRFCDACLLIERGPVSLTSGGGWWVFIKHGTRPQTLLWSACPLGSRGGGRIKEIAGDRRRALVFSIFSAPAAGSCFSFVSLSHLMSLPSLSRLGPPAPKQIFNIHSNLMSRWGVGGGSGSGRLCVRPAGMTNKGIARRPQEILGWEEGHWEWKCE